MNTIKQTPINLGDVVRDRLTGFSGIVVARTEWLYGCLRITVQPEELNKDGGVRDSVTFDEMQVTLILPTAVQPASQTTGGPRPEPARHADPR